MVNDTRSLGHNAEFHKAEIDAAMKRYREEWPEVCKAAGLSPYLLRTLDSSVLIALIMCSIFNLTGQKLIQLELRLARLEAEAASRAAETPNPLYEV